MFLHYSASFSFLLSFLFHWIFYNGITSLEITQAASLNGKCILKYPKTMNVGKCFICFRFSLNWPPVIQVNPDLQFLCKLKEIGVGMLLFIQVPHFPHTISYKATVDLKLEFKNFIYFNLWSLVGHVTSLEVDYLVKIIFQLIVMWSPSWRHWWNTVM